MNWSEICTVVFTHPSHVQRLTNANRFILNVSRSLSWTSVNFLGFNSPFSKRNWTFVQCTYMDTKHWTQQLYKYTIYYVRMPRSLVHINKVNLDEHGVKVETVRWSPFNTVGQDGTKLCTVRFQVYFRMVWYAVDLVQSPFPPI